MPRSHFFPCRFREKFSPQPLLIAALGMAFDGNDGLGVETRSATLKSGATDGMAIATTGFSAMARMCIENR